jgi:hypothetical protein
MGHSRQEAVNERETGKLLSHLDTPTFAAGIMVRLLISFGDVRYFIGCTALKPRPHVLVFSQNAHNASRGSFRFECRMPRLPFGLLISLVALSTADVISDLERR